MQNTDEAFEAAAKKIEEAVAEFRRQNLWQTKSLAYEECAALVRSLKTPNEKPSLEHGCPCGYNYQKAEEELIEIQKTNPEYDWNDLWCDHESSCKVLEEMRESDETSSDHG